MTSRRTFDIVVRPAGETYQSLLRALVPIASLFGVVIRSEKVRLTEAAESVLRSLEPYLVRVEEVTRWPGTQLIGGRVSRRYIYTLDEGSLGVLLTAASDLFQWINPGLPEDLHFLRHDGSTVLGSTAQEEDAWLEVDSNELERWREQVSSEMRDALREHSIG